MYFRKVLSSSFNDCDYLFFTFHSSWYVQSSRFKPFWTIRGNDSSFLQCYFEWCPFPLAIDVLGLKESKFCITRFNIFSHPLRKRVITVIEAVYRLLFEWIKALKSYHYPPRISHFYNFFMLRSYPHGPLHFVVLLYSWNAALHTIT